jgi:hypothetical protein
MFKPEHPVLQLRLCHALNSGDGGGGDCGGGGGTSMLRLR